MNKLPVLLKPLPIKDNSLIGRKKDGGYYLPTTVVTESKKLIGGGVSTSWDFELDILRINKNIEIQLFDHSISILIFLLKLIKNPSILNLKILIKFLRDFYLLKKLKFSKKFISDREDSFRTNIYNFLERGECILKLDIEGNEYPLLKGLSQKLLGNNALIIEFHDVDNHMGEIVEFVSEISSSFFISYTNINNYFYATNNTNLGRVLEMTLISDKFKDAVLEDIKIANDPTKKAIKIEYY